jgi:predicted TIM-barrel fold metal-dependent hydrolase
MWDIFNESRTVANFHIGGGARREEMEALRSGVGRNTKLATGPDGLRKIPPAAPTTWNLYGRQRTLAVHATQMYMSNVRIIVNLCMSDLFDRYPNLKIVSAESGIGWIPFALDALEHQLDETARTEASHLQRRPREYFRDHVLACFWFERYAPLHMIEDIGVNNVLFETDFPHPTCLWPDSQERSIEVLGHLDFKARKRVLQDNAAELYKIDVG